MPGTAKSTCSPETRFTRSAGKQSAEPSAREVPALFPVHSADEYPGVEKRGSSGKRITRTWIVVAQWWKIHTITSLSPHRYSREGGNPERAAMYGETVSRNGKKPGRLDG